MIPYGFCQCGCGEKTGLASQKIKRLGLEKGEPFRYVTGHHSRGKRTAHLAAKVRKPKPIFHEVDGEQCVSIPVTKGKWAIVSLSSYPKVSDTSWSVHNGYAVGRTPENKLVRMHRLICEPDDGLDVDHINGDRLDNRDCNLRPATRSQNLQNRRVHHLSPTGVRGVVISKNKFHAQIKVGGKTRHLGSYPTLTEAVEVRRKAEVEHFGEFSPSMPAEMVQ